MYKKCSLFYGVCSVCVPGIHMLNTCTKDKRILTKMLKEKYAFGLLKCSHTAAPKVKLLLNSERGQTGHRCNLLVKEVIVL